METSQANSQLSQRKLTSDFVTRLHYLFAHYRVTGCCRLPYCRVRQCRATRQPCFSNDWLYQRYKTLLRSNWLWTMSQIYIQWFGSEFDKYIFSMYPDNDNKLDTETTNSHKWFYTTFNCWCFINFLLKLVPYFTIG